MIEPELIVDELLASGKLEEILSNYSWLELDLFLVYPANRRITKRARVFSDYVQSGLG